MKKNCYISGVLAISLIFLSGQVAAQNIGIGNTNPQYRLDLSGRTRIRGGSDNNNSAGMWLAGTGTDSATNKMFMGMLTDSSGGFYSDQNGTGWFLVGDGRNGRVGIRNNYPKFPLSFNDVSGDKVSLFQDANGNYYGLGIGNATMQVMTPHNNSDILFGYGRSSNFTENMRIKGNGNVGIGETNPLLGGLVVNKKVGATNAVFGSNSAGVAIESTIPGIGFNTYDDDFSRKTIASGYGGYMGVNPSTGEMVFSTTNASFPAGSSVSSNLGLSITSNGNTGVGVTADPNYKMDVGGRMRIRSTPGFSAGLWLNNNSNSASPAFIGMQADDKVGFYGSGTGWGLSMNTQNGAISVAGSAGQPGQVLTSNGQSGSPSWSSPGIYSKVAQSDIPPYQISVPANSEVDIPNLIKTITLTSAAQVVFNFKIRWGSDFCSICPSDVYVRGYLRWVGGIPPIIAQIDGGGNAFTYTRNTMVSGPIILELGPGTYTYKVSLSNAGYTLAVQADLSELTWQIFPR